MTRGGSGADETTENAKYVLQMIKKEKIKNFTRRDIMRLCRRIKTADKIQAAINILNERGYVSEEQMDVKGAVKKQKCNYLVNPDLYKDFD